MKYISIRGVCLMKKVIALYASADKGKTQTLNKLIDLLSLISDYYEICRSDEGWAYFEIRGCCCLHTGRFQSRSKRKHKVFTKV